MGRKQCGEKEKLLIIIGFIMDETNYLLPSRELRVIFEHLRFNSILCLDDAKENPFENIVENEK